MELEIAPDVLADCPKEIEAAIPYLRDKGLSKVLSMYALVKVFGRSLEESKELVHFHSAWSDVRERDDQFHDELERAVSRYKD